MAEANRPASVPGPAPEASPAEPTASAPEAPAPAPAEPAASAPEAPSAPTGPFAFSRFSAHAARAEWLRPLVVVAVAMIVLTVVSTAAVLTVGGPAAPVSSEAPSSYDIISVPNFAAGSPEVAYLSYVAAIQKGDYDAADAMLSSSAIAAGEDSTTLGLEDSIGAFTPTVGKTEVDGDTATLYVTLQKAMGDESAAPTFSLDVTVHLVREGGIWKIDSEQENS